VIADDSALMREGISAFLSRARAYRPPAPAGLRES
jgi:hypothetical protein